MPSGRYQGIPPLRIRERRANSLRASLNYLIRVTSSLSLSLSATTRTTIKVTAATTAKVIADHPITFFVRLSNHPFEPSGFIELGVDEFPALGTALPIV
jgi:hypothetical protein